MKNKKEEQTMKTAVSKINPGTEQYTEYVDITPKIAAKFLEKNTHNRSMSPTTVAGFALDMTMGNWPLTHQGIAFKRDGTLADGQHRLQAVVESGCTVRMAVTYNISDEALAAIDAGRIRTVGDQMGLVYGIANSRKCASICTTLRNIEKPNYSSMRNTTAQSMEIYMRHKASIDWVISVMGSARIWGCAPLAGALAYGYYTDPSKADEFAKQVRDGENLSKKDPAYALRKFLLEMPSISSQGVRKTLTTVVLRCMFAYFHGHKLEVIRPNMLGGDSATAKSCFTYFRRRQPKKQLSLQMSK